MATDDDVRRLALALPGATERRSYGTPGFRVADKLFARLHQEPGLLVLWTEGLEAREELLAADPATFTTTAHYDGHPSVLVRLAAVEVSELAELLEQAWWVRAPARLRAAHDGPPSTR